VACDQKVKLSVVVTTFNRARQLDYTLDSLFHQTRQPDELIVSDDCSPDGTPEVAARWGSRFQNYIYSRNERNLYMPGNLNVAIARARGTYIANLHDADAFDSTLLEKWEQALDSHPTAGLAFCGGCSASDNPGSDKVFGSDAAPCTPGREFFRRYFVGAWGSPIWGTVIARRSAYAELGSFDPYFGFVSDVDMWMRFCGRFDIAYVAEPLLILDNEAKLERRFKWRKLLIENEMAVTNIRRLYAPSEANFKSAIERQKSSLRARFARHVLGRVRHNDWAGFREGLSLFRQIFVTGTMTNVWSGKGDLNGNVPFGFPDRG